MERPELSKLVVAPAETDADLEAMIAVRKLVTPRARPNVANLRHALESSTEGLTFIVARLGDEPVACGFVEGPAADFAAADVAVVPDRRRMGIGSAVLAHVSERARALGKDVVPVWIDVGRNDPFLQADTELARALRTRGTQVRLVLHAGGHNGWSGRMGEYLGFYAAACAGAG